MLGASYSPFIPDAKMMFRNNSEPILRSAFVSAPLEMARLAGQWRNDPMTGHRTELPIWINVPNAEFRTEDTRYVFSLEVDVSPRFSTPSAVAIYDFTKDAVNPFEILLLQEKLEVTCRYATHIRLVVAFVGGASGIQFSAYPRGDLPKM